MASIPAAFSVAKKSAFESRKARLNTGVAFGSICQVGATAAPKSLASVAPPDATQLKLKAAERH